MRTRLLALLTTAAAAGGAAGQGVPFVGVGSGGTVVTGTTGLPRPAGGPLAGVPTPPAVGFQAYPGTSRLGPVLPPVLGGFRDYGYGPGSYVPGR